MEISPGPHGKENRSNIKTETLLDVSVRWISVYAVAAIGAFLVVKEFLGEFAVCQPINKAIRENLSYSLSQSRYDAAYCTASMLDFTENLQVASTNEHGAIPGVTILGIKGKSTQVLHEKFIPFAFLIQAAVLYLPTLMWKHHGAELLRASIRYIAATSWKISLREAAEKGSTPSQTSTPKRGSLERHVDELESDVDMWLSRRSLVNVYVLKLIFTALLLVAVLCLYLLYTPLNIFSFKDMFVCHVDRQALVRCVVRDAHLFRLFWIVNLVLVDLCLLLTTFQLLNLAFCAQRRRNFFFLRYLGVSDRRHCKVATDAHLISQFCGENLSIMAPEALRSTLPTNELHYSTLIALGNSAELTSSSKSLVYDTAPQTPQRMSKEMQHNTGQQQQQQPLHDDKYEAHNYSTSPDYAPDYDKSCWLSVKEKLGLPFPNLPYYIDGEVKLTHTNAILRYIARNHDLCGKSVQERFRVDMIENEASDFRMGFIKATYFVPDFEEGKKTYLVNVQVQLKRYSDFLGSFPYFAGQNLTFCDFSMFEPLDQLRTLESTILDNFPNLKEFMDRIEALPGMKDYLQSETFLKRPISNKMGLWGTQPIPRK